MAKVVMVAVGGPRRASSRLRVHAWKPYLEALGHQVEVFALHPDPGSGPPATGLEAFLRQRAPRLAAGYTEKRFWTGVTAAARGADAVLLQETVPPAWAARDLRNAVGRLVFDFSDPIHTANGPVHSARHRLIQRWITNPRIINLLGLSDGVILENDLITDFAGQGGARVEVMRGPMDTEFYRPRWERDDVPNGGGRDVADGSGVAVPIVGWTGSNVTLQFLEPLVPTLQKLHREHPFRLHTVGLTEAPRFDGLDVVNTPWEMEAEARAVAGFDVALAWLPDTEWTRLRGGAKLIVYLAAGVPVVTSPGGIGDQVITPGQQGFVAATETEWAAHLTTLLTDSALRTRMARTARDTAVERHSYEAYLPLLLELLGID